MPSSRNEDSRYEQEGQDVQTTREEVNIQRKVTMDLVVTRMSIKETTEDKPNVEYCNKNL